MAKKSVSSSQGTTGTGQALTFNWQFGDTNTGTLPDPRHLYNTYGVKQVRLTITDEFGCTDDSLQNVEVFPLPTADFPIDPVCVFDQYTFTSSSTVPAGKQITFYEWDLGNDSTIRRGPETRFIYQTEGTYEIALKVVTENGCADSLTQSIDVYPFAENHFLISDACVFDQAGVINLSTIPNPVFGDVIEQIIWNWGDGNTTTGGDSVFHIYQAPGTYDITLTTITDKGCDRDWVRQVDIYPIPVSPVLVPDTACFGDEAFLMAMAPSDVTVNWYYNQSDPTPFQQGYSYVTPPNTFESLYYVEPVSDFGCIGERVPTGSQNV